MKQSLGFGKLFSLGLAALSMFGASDAWSAGGTISRRSVPSESESFTNPIFAYTHLLPSPLTLPAGRLALGTDVAFGVFDSFQVGTGLLKDLYQTYNANLKINLVNLPAFSLAAYGSVESYNYHNYDASNPDLRVLSWRPGLVGGYEVLPDVAGFIGANLNISRQTLVTSGASTSGYVRGAEAEYDLAWAYLRGRRGIYNVLSGGASYDFTYKVYGFGISHYWRGFRIGAHYYPNADKYKLQPILAGGASIDL
ncbi:MAG: hypothetical protein ACJ763_05840 [Bdellovibrionia bacterium]